MKTATLIAAGATALAFSAAVHAAQSDYFLKIEGVDGEAKVASWSFRACNAGQCSTIKSPRDAASGLATVKRQHEPKVTASQNTQSLRESPTSTHSHHVSDASAGAGADAKTAPPPRASWDIKENKGARLQIAAGDLDGDGETDLAYAATQGDVNSFTLTFQKIEATWRYLCAGKHFDKATLRSAGESFELTGVTVACTAAGVGP